jgi:hypothetical protein
MGDTNETRIEAGSMHEHIQTLFLVQIQQLLHLNILHSAHDPNNQNNLSRFYSTSIGT